MFLADTTEELINSRNSVARILKAGENDLTMQMGYPLVEPGRLISVPVFEFPLKFVPPTDKKSSTDTSKLTVRLQEAVDKNESYRAENNNLSEKISALRSANQQVNNAVRSLARKRAATKDEVPGRELRTDDKKAASSPRQIGTLESRVAGLDRELQELKAKVSS